MKGEGRKRIAAIVSEATEWLAKSTKNPVVVLLVGSLLGSFLIPVVQEKAAKREAEALRRFEMARTILDRASQVTIGLNTMSTHLGHVFKRRRQERPSAEAQRIDLTQEDERMFSHYQAFDEIAWWWYWPIVDEAEMRGLLSGKALSGLRSSTARYNANVEEAVRVVWRLRDLAIAGPVDADTARKVESDLEGLRSLAANRYLVARSMVYYFLAEGGATKAYGTPGGARE